MVLKIYERDFYFEYPKTNILRDNNYLIKMSKFSSIKKVCNN